MLSRATPGSPKKRVRRRLFSGVGGYAPDRSPLLRRSRLLVAIVVCIIVYVTVRTTLFRLDYGLHGPALTYGSNGMAIFDDKHAAGGKVHPFHDLITRAEKRWKDLLARQSRTLSHAVSEYRRRYGLDPPAGFDRWFAYCQRHGITIIDEYDQLMHDILAHHALKPAEFIARSEALIDGDFTYTFTMNRTGVHMSGPRSEKAPVRLKDYWEVMKAFAGDLPEGFSLTITGSDHDTGSQVLGQDQRRRALELVKQGRHFEDAELRRLEDPGRTPAWGWFKACDLDSPANVRPGAEHPIPSDLLPRNYIWNHLPTMDFCDFPELKRLHGQMSMDYGVRSESKLKPVLVWSKFPGDASFQATPMQNITDVTPAMLARQTPWDDRTDRRMFWRGKTSGGYDLPSNPRDDIQDWRDSHRVRLHLMFKGPRRDPEGYWFNRKREVMEPDGGKGYSYVEHPDEMLGKAYGDISVVDVPQMCKGKGDLCNVISEVIEPAAKIMPSETMNYRYMIDVDGNGWSSRFRRLLTSGGMVIKSTAFPEWCMDWLIPWYHYVPMKHDYSDLYDIASFFIGPMNANGKVDYAKGHDEIAKKIAKHGQEFVMEHWDMAGIQAYNFRLVLELRRLHSLDRAAQSYRD